MFFQFILLYLYFIKLYMCQTNIKSMCCKSIGTGVTFNCYETISSTSSCNLLNLNGITLYVQYDVNTGRNIQSWWEYNSLL